MRSSSTFSRYRPGTPDDFYIAKTNVYRVHQPKWSFAPTSGAGAGTHGGRANRIGVNALYLSEKLETALAEYQQLSPLMQPGLMVSYNLSIDCLVDFRSGYTSAWDPLWQDFYCDWRDVTRRLLVLFLGRARP